MQVINGKDILQVVIAKIDFLDNDFNKYMKELNQSLPIKTELQVQRDICVEVWNTLPETRHCLYHIKQELDAKLTAQQMIMLSQQKASGLLPGIQDLHFLWDSVTYRIELKRPGGDPSKQVSPAQKVIHAAHARQGSLTWLFNDSILCISFIRFIVENSKFYTKEGLNNGTFEIILKEKFSTDIISPFARPDMYEQYLSEYEQWVEKQREQRKKRSNDYMKSQPY